MKLKMTICMSVLLTGMIFSFNISAESELSQMIQNKKKSKPIETNEVKEKVLMCHDCEKPKVECVCGKLGEEEESE